jgi:hypothetical protein
MSIPGNGNGGAAAALAAVGQQLAGSRPTRALAAAQVTPADRNVELRITPPFPLASR